MSLALEVCGGASVLERRLRSDFLGFLALLVACVPPSISGAGHATRGEKVVGEGRESRGEDRARKLRLPLLAMIIAAHVRALIGHVPLPALCHPFNAPILLFELA